MSTQNGAPQADAPAPGEAQAADIVASEGRRDVAGLLIAGGIPTLVAACGVVALVLWLRAEPVVRDIQPRLPNAARENGMRPEAEAPANARPSPPTPAATGGMTATPATPVAGMPGVMAGGSTSGGGEASSASGSSVAALPGAWPGFRGANLDNVSPERGSLARSWAAGGPKRFWSVQLGEGHAGPAVLNGRVYVLDYDQVAKADKLRCLALSDGREIWAQSYPVLVKRNHGMSRTVPAVTDQHVVTLGPKCHVLCADARTGAVRWKIDLVREYGTKVPTWYAGQCPLIDGDRVILAPGGKALMIAVDLASGKVIWKAANPNGWKMTHSSIVPMTFGGEKMFVYCASGGVVGISARDGAPIWETDAWKVSTANVPTPVLVGGGRIFLCGGYKAGSMMLRLKKDGGNIRPVEEYRLKWQDFASDQQTPILYKGHIYGVRPGGQLACIDLGGKGQWDSGTDRFGLGPYLIAGGLIYALVDRGKHGGELVLAEATPKAYRPLARAKVVEGHDAWGPMALVGGRLLLRDLTTMVCVDVSGS